MGDNVFSRSWEITKLSWSVVKKDKEMLIYPILSAIFSVIYLVALLVPTIILALVSNSNAYMDWSWVQYVIIFVAYLGVAVISTFYTVCVVYSAKMRFSGQNPTVWSATKFAFSKLHLIFLWGVVSATAGVIFAVLDSIAEKAGLVGKIILSIIRFGLGMAWSILSLFVVPGIVYHDLGPFDAMKKSAQTFRKTWGENIIRSIGLGLMQFLFILLGIGLVLLSIFVLAPISTTWLIVGLVVSGIYILLVVLVFNVMNTIFSTALYEYADSGKIPGGFSKNLLSNAFQVKATH